MTKAQKLYWFKRKHNYYNTTTSANLKEVITDYERRLANNKKNIAEFVRLINEKKRDYKKLKAIEEE